MGKDMETNAIYCGDCKDVLANFPDESVDLIYLDPPFFTHKNYEIIWNDGYEIRSFKDAQWYSKDGKRREDIFVYLDWLKEKIYHCHRILKKNGTLYLHCDYHADSYIRVYVLDAVFGKNKFKNEIVWCYRGAGYPKKDFGRRHDTIFRYVKGNDYVFNVDDVRDEYANATKERFKHYIGNIRDGKDYGTQKLHPKGKHPDDWWEIQPIAPSAKARLGYPTQKPEELLEIIVKASSNPTDIVLDPMCGCGTTIVVGHKLKRRWIGVDISPTACNLMAKRVRKFGAIPKMIGMPKSIEQLKKIQHFDFQNWVLQKMHGRVSPKKVNDMGIDGLLFDGTPVQVKQSEKVGRNVIDNFETAIRRYYAKSLKEKKGVIVAFSFTSGAYNEVHRVRLESDLYIELKTVKELLNGN